MDRVENIRTLLPLLLSSLFRRCEKTYSLVHIGTPFEEALGEDGENVAPPLPVAGGVRWHGLRPQPSGSRRLDRESPEVQEQYGRSGRDLRLQSGVKTRGEQRFVRGWRARCVVVEY